MSQEIERKFLVKSPVYRELAIDRHEICQGYLNRCPERTVRVRVRDGHGFLTVKSRNVGAVRGEWEYEIPAADARELLGLCQGSILEKVRYLVPAADGHLWEVDEFSLPVDGLVLAEVELSDAEEAVEIPHWVGREVTGDPAYYNSNLIL